MVIEPGYVIVTAANAPPGQSSKVSGPADHEIVMLLSGGFTRIRKVERERHRGGLCYAHALREDGRPCFPRRAAFSVSKGDQIVKSLCVG